MNRREFLKTIVLALSALVLPKSKEPEYVYGGQDRLDVHKLTDNIPVTDEMMADVLTEDDIRKMFDRHDTLMGYPIVWCDYPIGYGYTVEEEEDGRL